MVKEMQKSFFKAMALTAVISFTTASVGFAAGGSIGLGDISVYKSGKLVSKLSGQNPIEDSSLLVCNGKCMIKSEGISLIGADSAKMAVTNEQDVFKLYVQEGTVDYIINSNVRKISFYTPQGTYTVAEAIFNAGSQSVVKGSVTVDSEGKTEIAVTEGRLVFATSEGLKTVDANNKIVLAMAPGAAVAGAGAGAGGLTAGTVVGGLAGAGAAVGTGMAVKNSNDSKHGSPASPSN